MDRALPLPTRKLTGVGIPLLHRVLKKGVQTHEKRSLNIASFFMARTNIASFFSGAH
jgi:hypothetical protein